MSETTVMPFADLRLGSSTLWKETKLKYGTEDKCYPCETYELSREYCFVVMLGELICIVFKQYQPLYRTIKMANYGSDILGQNSAVWSVHLYDYSS